MKATIDVQLKIEVQGKMVLVFVEMLNTGAEKYDVEKMNMGLGGFSGKITFEVTSLGKSAVSYIGPFARLKASTPADYIPFDPGESIGYVLRIDEFFNFTQNRVPYLIRYRTFNGKKDGTGLDTIESPWFQFVV